MSARRTISQSSLCLALASLCVLFACSGCYRKPTVTIGDSNDGTNSAATEEVAGPSHVGSERCAECHEEIATSYAGHSMGRSAAELTPDFSPQGDMAFKAGRFQYSARLENEHWIHRQGRIAKNGREVAPVELIASHVIGSGNHGQSFLINRGGHLFMSPMTWYPDEDTWALSPGYETNNSEFNRPVVEICLYCHTDVASPVANTLNLYEDPPIAAHAIGCERCHGPGSEHVAKQESTATGEGGDDSIVNPGRLPHDLREAVCQQCHLSGLARVKKPGKSLWDFKPGSRLESAYTIFTGGSKAGFVSHVEQMYSSKCFQMSDQAMGCITCHDPHGLPSENERVQFYRDRCLQCHTEESCVESSETRLAKTAEDSCIVCHMPNIETEVIHAASTNHAIPRSTATAQLEESAGSLVAFPADEVATPTTRDRALATIVAYGNNRELFSEAQVVAALPALKEAFAANPQDFEAAEALADLLLTANEIESALQVCRQVLAVAPRREQTLVIAADTYSQLQNFGQAIPLWKQAIQVNPYMARYWYKLGQAYAAMQQWQLCLQTAGDAKKRFPTSIGVRHLLMQSHFALGDSDAAAAEFREVEQFNPPGITSMRRWFEAQQAASATP